MQPETQKNSLKHSQGKNPGPTVALMGELDSLLVSDHPHADSETGAAHACGHNAQIAGLMGAMMGLVDTGAMDDLCGNIVIFAVPAEEYVEIEYRLGLMREGKLSFLGGKPELIQKGHFDDVDLQDDRDMQKLFMRNAQILFGAEDCTEAGHRNGSTDMGDISHIMPSVHPSISGASGILHGNDFLISDKEMAYLAPAKALAWMAVDLLYGNAEKAKEIQAQHKPIMSKEEYLSYQNRIFQKEIFDGETGTSTKLKV